MPARTVRLAQLPSRCPALLAHVLGHAWNAESGNLQDFVEGLASEQSSLSQSSLSHRIAICCNRGEARRSVVGRGGDSPEKGT